MGNRIKRLIEGACLESESPHLKRAYKTTKHKVNQRSSFKFNVFAELGSLAQDPARPAQYRGNSLVHVRHCPALPLHEAQGLQQGPDQLMRQRWRRRGYQEGLYMRLLESRRSGADQRFAELNRPQGSLVPQKSNLVDWRGPETEAAGEALGVPVAQTSRSYLSGLDYPLC